MLPKNLKYGNKVEASMARSYVSNISPNGALNGYRKRSVTTFMIPTGTNLALVGPESVLKFTARTVGAGDGRLDSCGAHGYIKRVRLWHASNSIEDTDEYGMLVKTYHDLQISSDASFGKYSILAGTRGDLFVNTAVALPANATGGDGGTTASALANAIKANLVNGLVGQNVNNGRLVPYGASITYTLTLFSILGSLGSANYFPLFECTSAPLRLEIQWANSIQSVGAFPSGSTGFQIDNIEYIASYLQLSDSAMSIINSGRSGPLSYTIQGVRNYNTTASLSNGATTQVNFGIPAKFGSVKNIITGVRDSARGVNTALYYPYSCVKLGLTQYYFKIGSNSSIPSIAPSTDPQFFCEVLKAVGSISDLHHHPAIDLTSYVLSEPVVNDTTTIAYGSIPSGCFYTGLDLENYAESDKSTIYTGYNTKNDDIFQVMTFVAPAAIASARFDAFVMFDQELVFENGTCYVSF